MDKIKKGYKKTKVGIIPEEWEVVRFKDIFIFNIGKNIKQNEASLKFNTPCIRYGELYHMYDEVIYNIINKTNLDISELLFSKGDEILIPSAGENPLDIASASALTLKNIAIGRSINILRPIKPNIYSQIYISYYINSQLKRKIASLAKGSSISNIYNSDLKNLKIPLPPLPEQKKIAKILTTWDRAIEKLKALIREKERLKKGLMQRVLSGKVRFKEFKEEWKEVRLGEIIVEVNQKSKTENKHQILSSTVKGIETRNGRVNAKSNIGYKILKKNQLVLSPQNLWLGNININTNFEIGLVSPSYKIFNINTCILFIDFAKYIFKTNKMLFEYKICSEIGASTVRRNLSLNLFYFISILLPPLPEQQKIAKVLTIADKEIELLKRELKALEEQKKGLMQKLLTGEIRVKGILYEL